jgi:hypothetical protein
MPPVEDDINTQYITRKVGRTSVVLLPQPISKKAALKELLLNDTNLMKEAIIEYIRDNPGYANEILRETYKAIAEQIQGTLNKENSAKASSLPEHSYLRLIEQDEFHKNVEAYKKMEEELNNDPSYRGAFVVLYKQKVVAKGHDKVKLLQDVYHEYGYVPVLVHKVGGKGIVHYRSPRSK